MGKLQSIQVLRAIAVLGVVYCHAFGTPHGSSGVDLFFVISGFIIARVSDGRSAGAFVASRFWRIWPLYLLAALPYVAWSLPSGQIDLPRLAATVTLWPIWGGEYRPPLLPVAWSLYFEILFYAAVALRLWSGRIALTVAGVAALAALAMPGPATHFLLSPISLEFAAGIALAKVRNFRFAAPALLVGLFLLFSPHIGFEGGLMLDPAKASLRLLIFGVPAVITVYGALGLERVFAGSWARPLVLIGDASYSIYLTHLIPVRALSGLPPALGLIVAIAVGVVVYRFVEPVLSRPPWRAARVAGVDNAALTTPRHKRLEAAA